MHRTSLTSTPCPQDLALYSLLLGLGLLVVLAEFGERGLLPLAITVANGAAAARAHARAHAHAHAQHAQHAHAGRTHGVAAS